MLRPDIHHESIVSGTPGSLPVVMPLKAKESDRRWKFWSGLVWGEWYAHSRLLLFFLGAWLLTVWILPQFTNPGWILVYGCIYALVAGPAMGGKDVLEGCEEYAFSLSATRREWFLARWALGVGILLLFTLLDLLALGLDLSQAVTRFYLDMGLMEPRGAPQPRLLYGLILAFPLACFSLTFALAANARGRGLVLSAWIWGGLTALALLRLGLLYEFWEWQAWTGYFACPILIGAALVAGGVGLRVFSVKEVVQPSKPLNMPAYWWAWVLLILSGLGAITLLLWSLVKELAKIVGK